MRYRRLLVSAMLGAAAATASLASEAQNIVVQVAPPAPRHEVVPTLRSGYEWAPGYWNWNGHRYVWVAGHTVRARGPDYHWVAPQWADEGGRYRFQAGRWEHGGHGSNDHHANDHRDNNYRDNNNRDDHRGDQRSSNETNQRFGDHGNVGDRRDHDASYTR